MTALNRSHNAKIKIRSLEEWVIQFFQTLIIIHSEYRAFYNNILICSFNFSAAFLKSANLWRSPSTTF